MLQCRCELRKLLTLCTHLHYVYYIFLSLADSCLSDIFISLDDNCSCIGTNNYIGSGQNCSFDSDGDGYPGYRVFCDFINKYCVDNCRYTFNHLQEDCDGDGIGDACTSYLDFDPDNVTLIDRSIVIEPGAIRFSLNLTFPHNSTHTVSVQSCEVGWIECEQFNSFSFSGSEEIELYLESGWNLNYLLLSIYHHYGNDGRNSSVRLLVISQNLSVPEFQSRSFVSVSGDRVWVGVSVTSCTSKCPDLSSSLWSVGLRDVNISNMTDYFSLELEYCEFLPSVHWFGFNSYVYSITVKKPTDLLNGRYRVNVTGYNISGDSTFSLLYAGLEDACESNLDLGLYWNWTSKGDTLNISCIVLTGDFSSHVTTSERKLERKCEAVGNWSGISGQCAFQGFTQKVLYFKTLMLGSLIHVLFIVMIFFTSNSIIDC